MKKDEISQSAPGTNSFYVYLKVISTMMVVVVIGAYSYKMGHDNCEKEFKPIVDNLETRLKKLEKRASVQANASKE